MLVVSILSILILVVILILIIGGMKPSSNIENKEAIKAAKQEIKDKQKEIKQEQQKEYVDILNNIEEVEEEKFDVKVEDVSEEEMIIEKQPKVQNYEETSVNEEAPDIEFLFEDELKEDEQLEDKQIENEDNVLEEEKKNKVDEEDIEFLFDNEEALDPNDQLEQYIKEAQAEDIGYLNGDDVVEEKKETKKTTKTSKTSTEKNTTKKAEEVKTETKKKTAKKKEEN